MTKQLTSLLFSVIFVQFLALLCTDAIPSRVIVVSNKIDKPAAEELVAALKKGGASVDLVNIEEFRSMEPSKAKVNVVVVLGDPKAYGGIRNLSAMVLGKEWSSFLISRNESFLGYLRNIKGVWWLVLAGHTREETLAPVLYLESTYFSDTPLEVYAVEYLRAESGTPRSGTGGRARQEVLLTWRL